VTRADERGLGADFLSIDMDALLRKLPARSFRSPHHWPVELVRSALIRGARRVDVTIRSGRVEILDDGPAIPGGEIDHLLVAFDPAREPLERQDAIAAFEHDRGIGLLAAFAPAPREVRIRTGGQHGRYVFRTGRAPSLEPVDKKPGTCITVLRREKEAGKEAQTLSDYCRHARADIFLDGRLVSRRSREAITSAQLPSWGSVASGSVWIPLSGDACRIWLLDHGVRWKQIVHLSEDGLVYEAAVECPADPPAELSMHVSSVGLDLYRALPGAYASRPELRDRIEELFFLHYRRTGSSSLIDTFAPFRLEDGSRISLAEIRRLARVRTLNALRSDDDPSRYLVTPHTLLLTPRQWEFLAEHASVSLTTPLPAPRPDAWPLRLARWAGKRISNAVSNLGLVRPVDDALLSARERDLLEVVSSSLSSGSYVLPGASPDMVYVIYSHHSGRSPGRLLDHRGRTVLAISRRHPLVERACLALEKDPRNIRMVLPMLTRGDGAWQPA